MDISMFTTAIGLLRNAIGMAKDANDLVADSPKRKAAEVALAQAEHQLSLASAQAAIEFDYNLCQCTFPPQIALLKSDGTRRCPICNRDTDQDYAPVMGIGGY